MTTLPDDTRHSHTVPPPSQAEFLDVIRHLCGLLFTRARTDGIDAPAALDSVLVVIGNMTRHKTTAVYDQSRSIVIEEFRRVYRPSSPDDTDEFEELR